MAILQSFAPFDVSTLANYLLFAQAPGNALNSLGWARQSGHGEVVWGNVVAVNLFGQTALHTTGGQYNFRGAFSGGTSYNGSSGSSGNDVVTSSGLTYICITPTQLTLSQVIPNTTTSLTLTSCGASGGGSTAAYNDSGAGFGAADSKKGFVFVVTGFVNTNNNGTFICTTNTSSVLTLANFNATAETHAATAASSTANAGYIGTIVNGAGSASFVSGAFTGKAFTTAGFVSGANNGNFTCLASASSMVGLNNGSAVAVTAAGTITSNEPPATSLANGSSSPTSGGFWMPYNFEIWKSTGPMSTTNPIYIRLTFASSNTTTPSIDVAISTGIDPTSGWPTGNVLDKNAASLLGINNATNGGSVGLECDFSGDADNFRMAMYRNCADNRGNMILVVDRAKSNVGTDLDTYTWVGVASNIIKSQVLFKPGAGGVSGNQGAAEPFWTPLKASGNSTNLMGYGSTPLLILPLIGYLANPQLGACVFKIGDTGISGSKINVVLYGTSHTYLLVKGGTTSIPNGSGEGVADAAEGHGVIGIQWE